MAGPEIYRFLRVLEYVGTREGLDRARNFRQVKGAHSFDGEVKIYEAILGEADQPIIGQLKIWCLQQIVAATEGKLHPDDELYRGGYVEAVQDMLRFMLPEDAYLALCQELDE